MSDNNNHHNNNRNNNNNRHHNNNRNSGRTITLPNMMDINQERVLFAVFVIVFGFMMFSIGEITTIETFKTGDIGAMYNASTTDYLVWLLPCTAILTAIVARLVTK